MSNGNSGNSQIWTIISTLFSVSGIAAVSAFVINLYKVRGERRDVEESRKAASKKEIRVDMQHDFDVLIADYKGQLAALQADFAAMRKANDDRYEAQRKFYDDKINTLSSQHDSEISAIRRESADQINRLRDEAYRNRLEAERLRGYVGLLQATNAQLRGGDPFGGTEHWADGYVVADDSGRIKQVSAAITRMFHYESDRDLIGRSITVLIPEDKRALHEAGLKKIKETGKLPDSMEIICAEGLTRDGIRFPISLQLAAWKGLDGKLTFNATVRERFDTPAPSLAGMAVAPDFGPPPPAANPQGSIDAKK